MFYEKLIWYLQKCWLKLEIILCVVLQHLLLVVLFISIVPLIYFLSTPFLFCSSCKLKEVVFPLYSALVQPQLENYVKFWAPQYQMDRKILEWIRKDGNKDDERTKERDLWGKITSSAKRRINRVTYFSCWIPCKVEQSGSDDLFLLMTNDKWKRII